MAVKRPRPQDCIWTVSQVFNKRAVIITNYLQLRT